MKKESSNNLCSLNVYIFLTSHLFHIFFVMCFQSYQGLNQVLFGKFGVDIIDDSLEQVYVYNNHAN